MAITIRGTTPATVGTGSNPVSLTLTGTRQPQAGDRLIIIHGSDYYTVANMGTPTVGGASPTAITNGTADYGSNDAHAIAYYFDVASTGDLTISATESPSGDATKTLCVYVLTGHNAAVAPVAANS